VTTFNNKNVLKASTKVQYAAICLFVLTTIFGLTGLNETHFWDDEAQVGIIAKNLLETGRLTGWDGRNLYAYRNGSILDEKFRPINSPLDYLVAALSFRIFGVSTWSGRLPFVIAGLGALAMFMFATHYECPDDKITWLFIIGFLSLSVSFILYIKTCRYYALSTLFSFSSFCMYRQFIRTRNILYAILFSASAILSFYSNYLLGTAFLISLAAIHFIINPTALKARDWMKMLLALSLFILAVVPYAIHYKIWFRPDQPNLEIWYICWFKLSLWSIRDLNLSNILPWTVIVSTIVIVIWQGKDRKVVRPIIEWGGLGIVYIIALSLFIPHQKGDPAHAPLRYLVPTIPFFAFLKGYSIGLLRKNTKIGAYIIIIAMISTNIFSLHPFNREFRWLLPAYIREITNPYPTSYKRVVEFFSKVAERDDTILALPMYANYPILFYLGEKMRICCVIDKNTHLPLSKLRKLDAPLFIDENFPKWIVSFGSRLQPARIMEYFQRHHVENGEVVGYEYRLVKSLDIYWGQTYRPELPSHHFGPKTDFDKRHEGVYIFRRS
jgi:glucose uptake protein GlcU